MGSTHTLYLITRIVHVGAMAYLLGGSIFLWNLSRNLKDAKRSVQPAPLLLAAGNYELASWIASGLIVLTGIGNLGAFGASLPGTSSEWGTIFVIKLICVFLFVLFSMIRSLFVFGLLKPAESPSVATHIRCLTALYSATVLFHLAILVLAISLAHG